MAWKRLLVPLDGSPNSEAALPYARALTSATGAALTLLMARPLPPARSRSEPETTAYLEGIAEPLRAAGLRVDTRTLEGEAATVILEMAARLDVAAVVMATHGRGGIARLVAGSVAGRVLRESLRPTLVIRPPVGKTVAALRRIIVPLDGSPVAEAALAPAMDLARAAQAAVTLLRVAPPGPAGQAAIDGAGVLLDVARIEEQHGRAAGLYLAEVRATLPADVRIEAMVLRGAPGAVLTEVLGGGGVDLAVMSTHGRGGLHRLVMGSVAEQVVRAGVPVLLVRAAPATDEPQITGQDVRS